MKTIEEVRDDLLQVVDAHRATCGDPGCAEPSNMMAFLLHSVGIRSEDMRNLGMYLARYEAHCEHCQHMRN